MGEVYNLNEDELNNWREKVLKCLQRYKASKDVLYLSLFLVWLYEFIEVYPVNRTGQQAKLINSRIRSPSVYLRMSN